MDSKPYKTLKRHLIGLLAIALLLGACASARSEPVMYEEGAPAEPELSRDMTMQMESEEIAAAPRFDDVNKASLQKESKRIIVKNANISIVVDDPSTSLNVISQMAEEMGGFVVSANLYQVELENGVSVSQVDATIRVPAEKLNEALSQIKSQSDQDPLRESIDSQDFTREYTDLQSRLRHLETTEAQLTKIMDEARDTEDVLAVYKELTWVQEEIEVTKGQIAYYENASDLSAIKIELIADEAIQPLTIGGWQPVGVAKNALQILINALKFIVNIVIYLVIFVLPILLVLTLIFVLPMWLILRTIKRRRSKKKGVKNQGETNKQETQG